MSIARGPVGARGACDRGAATPIGLVLVVSLTLAALATGYVLAQPAIERARLAVAVEEALASFEAFDADVEAVSGPSAASGHGFRWRHGAERGTLEVDEGYHWAFAIDRVSGGNADYRLLFRDIHASDPLVTVYNDGRQVDYLAAEAWVWDGDQATPLVLPYIPSPLAPGESRTVPLPFPPGGLSGRTVELRFHDGAPAGDAIAHLWLFDAGALTWTATGGGREASTTWTNTGLVVEHDGDATWAHGPRLRGPADRAETVSVHLRVVSLRGNVSHAGQGAPETLATLASNAVRLDLTDDLERVQLYPPAQHADLWAAHLDDDAAGFTFTVQDVPGGGPKVALYEEGNDPGDPTLVASLAETTLSLRRAAS